MGEVFSTHSVLDLRDVRGLQDGSTMRAAEKAVDGSIPRSLAIMQRHHVKHEMIRRRGKGRGGSKGQKLHYRTGELARSYRVTHRRGSLRGSYGSGLERALILEEGGVIRPKGRYLAIPMPGQKGWPRERSDLFFYRAKSGKPALATVERGRLTVAYLLRRQVRIPPRPTLQNTIDKTRGKVFELTGAAVERALADAQ